MLLNSKITLGRTYDLACYGGRCGYVKDYSMSGRVTVFLSGKMISTGAKSTVKSIEQLQQTIDLLVNAKFIKPIKLIPTIQNIVGTMDVENRIDLKNLSLVVPKIIYEPHQFPGAIFRTSRASSLLNFFNRKSCYRRFKIRKRNVKLCYQYREYH